MKTLPVSTLLLYACGCFVSAGCTPAGDAAFNDYTSAPQAEHDRHGHDHDGEHGHEEHGPHGGHVVEFHGDHGLHAEIVMNADNRDITVYLLDESLAMPVAVAADGFEFDLEIDDQEIELTAKPQPRDGELDGLCSVFVIAGSDVPDGIKDIEELHAEVEVKWDGKELNGHVGHGHGGHDDDHDMDDNDDHDDADDDDKPPVAEEPVSPAAVETNAEA